jgi:hypothetical protein
MSDLKPAWLTELVASTMGSAAARTLTYVPGRATAAEERTDVETRTFERSLRELIRWRLGPAAAHRHAAAEIFLRSYPWGHRYMPEDQANNADGCARYARKWPKADVAVLKRKGPQ